MEKRKNDTLAINLVFHLTSLKTLPKISETLSLVYSLKPSIVVLVEQEGTCNSNKLLHRFMESLHKFAAIFDSLDDCLPLESDERLSIERDHLGREIRKHGVGEWREGALWELSRAVMQAKLLAAENQKPLLLCEV